MSTLSYIYVRNIVREIVNRRPDNIIECICPKRMDGRATTVFMDELREELHASTKKSLVLCDLTALEDLPTMEAKNIISRSIKDQKPLIAKSVICGIKNPYIKMALRLMITIAKRADIKIVDSREEAIKYLLES